MRRSFCQRLFLLLALALPLSAQATVTASDIQALYIGYDGHPADPSGLAYWAAYAAGTDDTTALHALSNALGTGAEYLARLGSLTQDQKVAQIITTLFSRSASGPETAYWSDQVTSTNVTLAQLPQSIAGSAQPADAAVLANKVTAAQAFTAAVDTAPEIAGYSNSAAYAYAAAYIAGVSDNASLASATAAGVVDATVAAAIAAGTSPTPTQTPTASPSATVTPSFSATATASATSSPSPSSTVTPTRTATPSPSATVSLPPSPSVTDTPAPTGPQRTQTSIALSWTPTPVFLSAPANAPVLGPVPAKRGEPVCIASKQARSSVKVALYNSAGQRVSTFQSNGGQPCLSTRTFAPGIYNAVIESDGQSSMQKIAIVP